MSVAQCIAFNILYIYILGECFSRKLIELILFCFWFLSRAPTMRDAMTLLENGFDFMFMSFWLKAKKCVCLLQSDV